VSDDRDEKNDGTGESNRHTLGTRYNIHSQVRIYLLFKSDFAVVVNSCRVTLRRDLPSAEDRRDKRSYSAEDHREENLFRHHFGIVPLIAYFQLPPQSDCLILTVGATASEHIRFSPQYQRDSRFGKAQTAEMSTMTAMTDMATKWLFGSEYRRGTVDEDLGLIREGPLFLHTGFSWREGYWKLVWRDELKSQAMLLRYGRCGDLQPLPGKASCVLLSTVRTLVPIEAHELKMLKRKTSAVPRRAQSPAGAQKYRFALETLDGSSMLLAAPSAKERHDWLGSLYSLLVRAFTPRAPLPLCVRDLSCFHQNSSQIFFGNRTRSDFLRIIPVRGR